MIKKTIQVEKGKDSMIIPSFMVFGSHIFSMKETKF